MAVPATWSLLILWAEASLGPCPQHCTALRAAAPLPQAAGPAGILLLLSPTVELATWGPISRCHPASQCCQCCHLPCVPCRLRQGLGQVRLPSSAVSSHPGGRASLLLPSTVSIRGSAVARGWLRSSFCDHGGGCPCRRMPMTPGPAVSESCVLAHSAGTKALLGRWSTLSSQPGTEYGYSDSSTIPTPPR